MKRYYEFKEYIEKGWAESTAQKYSSAINTISDELLKYRLIDTSIYMIDDINIINNLLIKYWSVPELLAKDIRGNRMYSNAIKRYLEFYIANK